MADEKYINIRICQIEKEAAQQEKDMLSHYGMLNGCDLHISLLRRVGFIVDDIGVSPVHWHCTNIQANEAYI